MSELTRAKPCIECGELIFDCAGGMWVAYGTTHFCQARVTVNPSIIYTQEAGVSDFEMNQLAEIVEALEKARTAFTGLADDTDKGRGNRAAAYLAARFGVDEAIVTDMLLEES